MASSSSSSSATAPASRGPGPEKCAPAIAPAATAHTRKTLTDKLKDCADAMSSVKSEHDALLSSEKIAKKLAKEYTKVDLDSFIASVEAEAELLNRDDVVTASQRRKATMKRQREEKRAKQAEQELMVQQFMECARAYAWGGAGGAERYMSSLDLSKITGLGGEFHATDAELGRELPESFALLGPKDGFNGPPSKKAKTD